MTARATFCMGCSPGEGLGVFCEAPKVGLGPELACGWGRSFGELGKVYVDI